MASSGRMRSYAYEFSVQVYFNDVFQRLFSLSLIFLCIYICVYVCCFLKYNFAFLVGSSKQVIIEVSCDTARVSLLKMEIFF